MTSNKTVEKLLGELDTLQGEMSSFMILFEGLVKTDSTVCAEDYDTSPCTLDHLPYIVSSWPHPFYMVVYISIVYVSCVESLEWRKGKNTEFWGHGLYYLHYEWFVEKCLFLHVYACWLLNSLQLKDPCFNKQDDWDETQMQKMEAARKAYEAAVVAAKERQDEESIAAAASARLHLRSFVLKT